MKYIFIDTDNYIFSAVSSQKEHRLESYEKIKDVIRSGKAVLILPEIVEIEFYRRVSKVYSQIMDYYKLLKDTIKKMDLPPYIASDKQILLNTVEGILKEKNGKYKYVLKETKELFSLKGNRFIPISADIFVKAYVRCLKEEKPFKSSDSNKINSKEDPFRYVSWMGDTLIAESIISECRSMNNKNDVLIFCSNNVKDFADFEKKSQKHVLHENIAREIKVPVIYYTYFSNMLELEFKESISKNAKKEMEDTQKYYEEVPYSGLSLYDILKERESAISGLKKVALSESTLDAIAGLGVTGSLSDILKERESAISGLKKVALSKSTLDAIAGLGVTASLSDILKRIGHSDEIKKSVKKLEEKKVPEDDAENNKSD